MNIDEIHNQLKNHPSYIDRQFYEKRLKQKAHSICSDALEGLSEDEFIETIVKLEGISLEGFSGDIYYNLPEACAIINILNRLEHFTSAEVSWKTVLKTNGLNQDVTKEMSCSEMINRLKEISHEDFGSNISEWNKWLAAWELYPIPTGNR